MKIIYCNGDMDNGKDEAQDKLRAAGHEVIYYNITENERRENLWTIRHFQMYEEILDMAENADVLYFTCPINCPEVFLYNLKTRPNFKAKVISSMMFREVNRSLARAMSIKDLIDMPQFGLMVFSSMLPDSPKLPTNLEKVGIDRNKIMLISEPYNEDPQLFKEITRKVARNIFNIKQDEKVLLNSGSWNYIRGADLFAEAVKYIDPDIKILLHKNRSTHTDPTLHEGLIEKAKKNHPNTIVIEAWIPRGQMAYFYIASDVVLCSHRKLYEYSVSGIPNMAALAKKPIVAPDFYYFNEIVNRFKTGILYEPENIEDMVKAIHHCFVNYEYMVERAEFEKSLANYIEATDRPLEILKRLK